MAKKNYDANREIESFRTNDGDTEEVLLSTRERMLREGGGDIQSLADRVDILEQTLQQLFPYGTLLVNYGGTNQSNLSDAFASMVSDASDKPTPALTDYAMISDGDADGTGKIQLSDLQTLIAGGALQASNNLDDVANKSASFSNLMKGATSPSADQYDSFVVVKTVGERHYPGIRTRGNIADDLASVGGLMKGSNNLSDLSSVSTAIENLVGGTEVSAVTENSRIPFKSSAPVPAGYAKLSSIWSWIKGEIASVLGLEENSGTKTYSGTAARATTSENINAVYSWGQSGGRQNIPIAVTGKQGNTLYSSVTDATETFSLPEHSFAINAVAFVADGDVEIKVKNIATTTDTTTTTLVTITYDAILSSASGRINWRLVYGTLSTV
jgi:hypothetical protein